MGDMLWLNGGQDGPGSSRYEVMIVRIANKNDETMNMMKISICKMIVYLDNDDQVCFSFAC